MWLRSFYVMSNFLRMFIYMQLSVVSLFYKGSLLVFLFM